MDNLSTGLSLHKDPFKKDCVQQIHFYIHSEHAFKYMDKRFHADIVFQNGNTSGRHEIRTTDFASAVAQTQAFVDSLASSDNRSESTSVSPPVGDIPF